MGGGGSFADSVDGLEIAGCGRRRGELDGFAVQLSIFRATHISRVVSSSSSLCSEYSCALFGIGSHGDTAPSSSSSSLSRWAEWRLGLVGFCGLGGAKAQMDRSPGPSRPSSLRHRSWDFAGSCDDGELDGCLGDANLERAAAKPSSRRSCTDGLDSGVVTRFGGGGGVDVGGEEASLTRGLK